LNSSDFFAMAARISAVESVSLLPLKNAALDKYREHSDNPPSDMPTYLIE